MSECQKKNNPSVLGGGGGGSCYSIFSFICVLLIVVCPFALFLLAIVLSVLLRHTDSDCPFGTFKLFLTRTPTRNMKGIHIFPLETTDLVDANLYMDDPNVAS